MLRSYSENNSIQYIPGKTSTIKSLIGHNNDVEFPTSDVSSATKSTIEYNLTMKTKNARDSVNGMSLGIVDTPGADDTDGIEQDARNVASIKNFLDSHESLRGKVFFN